MKDFSAHSSPIFFALIVGTPQYPYGIAYHRGGGGVMQEITSTPDVSGSQTVLGSRLNSISHKFTLVSDRGPLTVPLKDSSVVQDL